MHSSLPLIPKVGPWDGCLTQAKTFFFRQEPKDCANPIVVVLLPSPSGVGVILFDKNKVDITSPWQIEMIIST